MSINKDHEFVWYVLNDDTDDEKVFAKEPDAWKEMFKQSAGNRKILRMPAPSYTATNLNSFMKQTSTSICRQESSLAQPFTRHHRQMSSSTDAHYFVKVRSPFTKNKPRQLCEVGSHEEAVKVLHKYQQDFPHYRFLLSRVPSRLPEIELS